MRGDNKAHNIAEQAGSNANNLSLFLGVCKSIYFIGRPPAGGDNSNASLITLGKFSSPRITGSR